MAPTENKLEDAVKKDVKPVAPPAAVPIDPEEHEALRGMVAQMRKDIDSMKKAPATGATIRNRTKTHEVFLREYAEGDTVVGIVTKLYNVREKKDPSENKRYIGLCTLDVVNPITKKETTVKDVDYLVFLNEAKRVLAKVSNWKREVRYEVDPKKGGGGVGPLKRVIGENEVVVDNNFEFEVGYTDHAYTLMICEGHFDGAVMETDEKALNI